jgi:hypothetical protein
MQGLINWQRNTTAQWTSSFYEWDVAIQLTDLTLSSMTSVHSLDGTLAITQKHAIVVIDLLHTHALDDYALAQKHTLTVADATHANALDNVDLDVVGATTSVWVLQNMIGVIPIMYWRPSDRSPIFGTFPYWEGSRSLGEDILSPADLLHGHTLDAPTITQKHTLASVADLAHTFTADALTFTDFGIAVADLAHTHSLDNITVIAAGELAGLDDLAHAHTLDAITLTQAHTLSNVAELLHSHALDATQVLTGTNLIVSSLTTVHTLDGTTLTQAHVIVVNDATHVHRLAVAPLRQKNLLTVAEMLHAHGVDQVDFDVAQGIMTVTFTSAGPSVTWTSKRPTIDWGGKGPKIEFDS